MIIDKNAPPQFPDFIKDPGFIEYDGGLGGGIRILQNASSDDFERLCTLTFENGFSQRFDRKTDRNVYRGYFKGSDLLYIYYSEPRAEVRMVFEPKALLPSNEPLLSGKCSIAQLSLDQTNVDCGMSYVIQCCDKSFFIIDGGYFTEGECDRLYDYLRDNQSGEIVINGWFCTHAHNDHFGCFSDFIKKYSDKVKIEQLFFNFPSMTLPESDGWNQPDIQNTYQFYDTLNKYASDIPIIRLHTGEEFTVRNLHFEVIYTHEDLYPHKVYNFNDTSTLLIMTANGKKTLWLGDMSDDASDVIVKTCPERLKCDIVQVSHHGFNGAKTEIYELADAKTIFWPTADYRFDENIWRPANTYLLTPNTGRDHIVSGYGTKIVIL